MSWSINFVAPNKAAAVAALNGTAAQNEHAALGVGLILPVVQSFPDADGFGIVVVSNGHVAPGGDWSNVTMDVRHIQIAPEAAPAETTAE